MTASKKVSVIVPIYNVEQYLENCLQSIAMQTYENFEVLMINDGTPDRSAEIAKRFQDLDERFVLLEKDNGGLSSARNYGLDHASGEFICFIDSDDYIMPMYIEHLIDKIGETDVVIGKYIFDDREIGQKYIPFECQRINKEYSRDDKTREIVERLMFDCLSGDFEIQDTIMPVWKNMYRRAFVEQEKIRFFSERQVYMEDFLFNLEIYAKAKSVMVIEDADYVHLNLRGTLSQSYRPNMFEMQMKNYDFACAILRSIYGESMVKKYDLKLPYIVAYSAFKLCHGTYKEAMRNLKKLVHDDRVKSVTEKYQESIMPKYIKLIYSLLRYGRKRSIFVLVKAMCMFRFVYCVFRMKSRK